MMEITIYYTAWDGKSGSHKLLTKAAGQWLSACGRPVPESFQVIVRNPNEKPYFAEMKELEFSISHSGKVWMCAFGKTAVGLDVQGTQNCRKEKVSRRFFHPEEDIWLQSKDYEPFFQVWAAKESYLKYTGAGLTGGMDGFSVVGDEGLSEKTGEVQQRHFLLTGEKLLPDYKYISGSLAVCVTAEEIGEVRWIRLAEN